MAQPQLKPPPSSSPLTLVPDGPPHQQVLRARRRLLARGLTAIAFCALLAIGYLSCLVRIMEIDADCKAVLEECRRKEAEIGGLTIRLSAATDVRTIELFASERHLAPPLQVDEVEVSPALCSDASAPTAGTAGQLRVASSGTGLAGFSGR
jgi:hypothetical protein